MKDEHKVIKPNSIAEMTLVDMRTNTLLHSKAFFDVFDMILSKARLEKNEELGNLEYTFKLSEYVPMFDLEHERNSYRKMFSYFKKAFDENPQFQVKKDGKIRLFRVLRYVDFYDKSNLSEDRVLKVTVDEEFKEIYKEYRLQKGEKIIYELPDTLRMSSAYSKKMYPLLLERIHQVDGDRMKFSGEGTLHGEEFDRIDSLENLKSLLSFPDSYAPGNIKVMCGVIIDEIESCTPYHAECYFNRAKKGVGAPALTHVCWKIEKKPAEKAENTPSVEAVKIVPDEQNPAEIRPDRDEIEKWFEGLNGKEGLNMTVVVESVLKNKRDEEFVRGACKEANRLHTINDITGLIIKFMTTGYDKSYSVKNSSVKTANERHTDYNQIVLDDLMEDLK